MTIMIVNGRIGRDAELKYTSDGTAFAGFNVAYNYGRKGDDGNRPSQWVQCTMWGKQAEALCSYLTKGTGVLVTLEDVHINEYQKNDGTTGSALRGRVLKFEFGMNAPKQDGQQTQQPQQQQQRPVQQAQQQQPQQQQQQSYQAASQGGYGDMDDDIPFAPYFSRNGYAF